jgi:hypothetical protein
MNLKILWVINYKHSIIYYVYNLVINNQLMVYMQSVNNRKARGAKVKITSCL